jgi:four helix bundle protein
LQPERDPEREMGEPSPLFSLNRIVVLGRLKADPLRGRLRRALTRPARDDGTGISTQEIPMKDYDLALDTVRDVAVINHIIARTDQDLARQLSRCSMSMPLNINEGMYSRGKNRSARLTDAMASAKQSVACLEVAAAVGYVGRDSITECLGRLDHLVAALWNMIHRPWR